MSDNRKVEGARLRPTLAMRLAYQGLKLIFILHGDRQALFHTLLEQGSLLGIALCFYGACVYFGVLVRAQQSPHPALDPPVLHGTLGAIFKLAAIPANLWLAIYISRFEGLLLGVVVGMVLFAFSAFLAVVLKISRREIGLQVVLGLIALGFGYYLTFTSLP
ncbi:hypothetical protein BMI91_13150 [Thioclava sediminum]|uniref:Tripartite tricarboxylate transporter TctB family protein n=1 Tax=Thioclava sediminum TaxID=1915319 RepID=A0ABX3MY03_9RHOB|nr:hypothetical protein [Thioclava sediminum]OOY23435.1 hypothetical protein BMI91_13150 [Thioclava sediminum]